MCLYMPLSQDEIDRITKAEADVAALKYSCDSLLEEDKVVSVEEELWNEVNPITAAHKNNSNFNQTVVQARKQRALQMSAQLLKNNKAWKMITKAPGIALMVLEGHMVNRR